MISMNIYDFEVSIGLSWCIPLEVVLDSTHHGRCYPHSVLPASLIIKPAPTPGDFWGKIWLDPASWDDSPCQGPGGPGLVLCFGQTCCIQSFPASWDAGRLSKALAQDSIRLYDECRMLMHFLSFPHFFVNESLRIMDLHCITLDLWKASMRQGRIFVRPCLSRSRGNP